MIMNRSLETRNRADADFPQRRFWTAREGLESSRLPRNAISTSRSCCALIALFQAITPDYVLKEGRNTLQYGARVPWGVGFFSLFRK
jgi:hypothetical protein